MNRRTFLKYSFLGVLSLTLPVSLHLEGDRLILIGDGETDCSIALQAWLDGHNVYVYNNGKLEKFIGYLPAGNYLCKSSLHFSGKQIFATENNMRFN